MIANEAVRLLLSYFHHPWGLVCFDVISRVSQFFFMCLNKAKTFPLHQEDTLLIEFFFSSSNYPLFNQREPHPGLACLFWFNTIPFICKYLLRLGWACSMRAVCFPAGSRTQIFLQHTWFLRIIISLFSSSRCLKEWETWLYL